MTPEEALLHSWMTARHDTGFSTAAAETSRATTRPGVTGHVQATDIPPPRGYQHRPAVYMSHRGGARGGRPASHGDENEYL